MSKQSFDEHIKEQFSNSSPDVPSHIWENIIAERKNRKPKGFWLTLFNGRNLFLSAGLVIAGAATTWLVLSHSAVHTGSDNKVEKTIARVNADKKTNPSSTTNNEVSQTNSIQANDISKINTNNSIRNSGSGQQNNTSVPGNNGVSAITATNTMSSIYSPLHLANHTKAVKSILLPGKKENYTGRDDQSVQDAYTSINSDLLSAKASPNDLPAGGSLFGRIISGMQKLSGQQSGKLELQNRLVANVFLPGCPSFEKDAAGNKRYVEFYAGPDYAFRSFSDTANSTYLQKRKESTQFTSAFSAGVRYTRVFDNGVSLRTGINYSQINEKFTFVQGNLVQVTYIIDANGDTTGSYTVRGTRYKTTYNKYRSIDIPLLVGYELGNGKLHANINAGAIINAYSWQKGDVLDTSLMPVNITTGKTSSPYQFKTNVGVGFMGAVSLYYKINYKLHILAEPYYKHNFSPMNKDNLTLKQKYNTVGLKLGIRIDLP